MNIFSFNFQKLSQTLKRDSIKKNPATKLFIALLLAISNTISILPFFYAEMSSVCAMGLSGEDLTQPEDNTCIYPDCQNKTRDCCRYCKDHKCIIDNCDEPRAEDSNYCDLHKCKFPDCKEPRK